MKGDLMERLLDPKNDWMFKQLFGTEKRKDLTIHLINSLLKGRQPRVVDVKFLKVELDKEITALRQSIVDVLCQADDGREFIVEMQRASDTYFIKRLVEYTCQVYINQRPKALKTDGDRGGYDKVHPVVCLAIMENPVFPDKKAYLSHHELRDIETHTHDIKELSFTFLELSKFNKPFEELETDTEKWAYFFRHAVATSQEQFDEILKEQTVFSRAYEALREAAYTPEQLVAYLRIDQKQAEIKIQNAESRELGRAEGRAEGEKEKAEEIALKMLEEGLNIDIVSKLTGLPATKIQELKHR